MGHSKTNRNTKKRQQTAVDTFLFLESLHFHCDLFTWWDTTVLRWTRRLSGLLCSLLPCFFMAPYYLKVSKPSIFMPSKQGWLTFASFVSRRIYTKHGHGIPSCCAAQHAKDHGDTACFFGSVQSSEPHAIHVKWVPGIGLVFFSTKHWLTLRTCADVMQVTVKFGEHLMMFHEIKSETLGKELKALIETRLGPLMRQNAQFQVRSLVNGRILRENQTLEEACLVTMFYP